MVFSNSLIGVILSGQSPLTILLECCPVIPNCTIPLSPSTFAPRRPHRHSTLLPSVATLPPPNPCPLPQYRFPPAIHVTLPTSLPPSFRYYQPRNVISYPSPPPYLPFPSTAIFPLFHFSPSQQQPLHPSSHRLLTLTHPVCGYGTLRIFTMGNLSLNLLGIPKTSLVLFMR